MRPLGRAALLLVLGGGPGLVLALEPAPAPAAPTFKVTSRSLAGVSIDGGRAHGVKVGDRLRVVAGATTVAELEVVSVAERQASCRAISTTRPISVGDVVVPLSRPAPASAVKITSPVPPARTTTAGGFAALKGSDAAPATPSVAASTPSPAPVVAAASAPAPTALPAPVVAATPTPPPAAPPAPVVAAASTPPTAVPSPTGRRCTVKYRSAGNVYLDAGRAQGLEVGDRVKVVAGQVSVAELEVVYAAEQSASCKVVSETRPVRAGDVAVLPARASSPAASAATPSAPPSPAGTSPTTTPAAGSASYSAPATTIGPSSRAPRTRVRGSASVGYYSSWDQSESNYDYNERTARLDLGVYDIGGRPLSLTLRGRSRQDSRTRSLSDRTPMDERTDRLYEVALRYEPPSDNVGFEAGRIGLYRFVGIGYLDGALARFRPVSGVQVGAFGGRVADVDGLGYNGTGSKYGAFVRLAPGGRYAMGGYDSMLSFVRENAEGEVSREYLSLESHFGSGGRWSLFERAELDLNTGWRKDVTSKSVQLSNVSLSGNLRVTPSTWAFVSYDGRRNYRYYQNRIVPEEVFDDLLHQGLRAGLNLSKPGGFGATAGFGMSLKEPDPRHPELDVANAYSGNAGVRHSNVFSSGFSAGIDGSWFSNGYTDGGLLMARLGRRFPAGHAVDLSFGRSLYRLKLTQQDRTTQWLRLTGRGELGHRVYLQGDFEYDTGDDLKGPRGSLELGVLF
jgi:hypothetical protein